MKWLQAIGLMFVGILAFSLPAGAVDPNEMLDDPKLEARARILSAELRCVVCQNQSIDDSDAPLAKDLRRLVRERLVAGDSDDAVKSYLVARYGTFVLLKPPLNQRTVLLWLLPFLLGVAAVVAVYRNVFRIPSDPEKFDKPAVDLTADEHARLDKILKSSTSKRSETS